MPGSSKILKNRQHAANRAAGIGDAQGRIVKEKTANTMAKCSICQLELRMTKKNVEAQQHVQSKHPTSSWETCFPGQTKPEAGSAFSGKPEGGQKLDIDRIRAEAAEAKSIAEGGESKAEKAKKKKKQEDFSFLDDAMNNVMGNKKNKNKK
jgi:hypothetical protein